MSPAPDHWSSLELGCVVLYCIPVQWGTSRHLMTSSNGKGSCVESRLHWRHCIGYLTRLTASRSLFVEMSIELPENPACILPLSIYVLLLGCARLVHGWWSPAMIVKRLSMHVRHCMSNTGCMFMIQLLFVQCHAANVYSSGWRRMREECCV